jgi:hypothetical protein
MKTLIKNLIILTGLFLCISLKGQQIELNNFYNDYLDAKRRNSSYFDNIGGSPYYNSEFEEAKIFMNGTSESINSKMRYNNCFDEMEFLTGDDDEYLLLTDKGKVDSILLNGKVYQYHSYLDGKEELYGFFIRLTNTNPALFLKRSKKFQEERAPQSGYEDFVPAAFINEKDVFYIGLDNKSLMILPTRKNKIREFFNDLGYVNNSTADIKYDERSLSKYVNGLKKK